jgi:hypothetical protein
MLNKDMSDINETKQEQKTMENTQQRPNDTSGVYVRGHIKISDVTDKDAPVVLIDKPNAIHYENMSEAIAYSLSHRDQQFMYEMHFGNGGSAVDSTGVITYLIPNTTSLNATLYNPTYSKIIDDSDSNNPDPSNNKMQVRHVPGNAYTDIIISCLLDYGEPATQNVFDNSTALNDTYTFDELGIKARSLDGTSGLESTGKLLTHVIFHPVQKSLNRLIQIDYTVRIQTLTNLSAIG